MNRAPALASYVFCIAAAITAAALASLFVESLSNAGVFGAGPYTDHSNAAVVPALCCGAAFAVAFVCGLARKFISPRAAPPAWLRRAADMRHDDLARIAGTLGFQVVALFVMETCEQAVVWGHPLGGTIWLGGPVLVSLMLHAIVGLAVTAIFAFSLRWLALRVGAVLRFVRRLIHEWSHGGAASVRTGDPSPPRVSEPVLRRTRGRAPPALLHPM